MGGDWRAVVDAVRQAGGVMTLEDLAAHESTWVEPIGTSYRGMNVWECPPNGQGITALIALNILEGFDLKSLDPGGPERWHLLIEALRVAEVVYQSEPEEGGPGPAPSGGKVAGDEARRVVSGQ